MTHGGGSIGHGGGGHHGGGGFHHHNHHHHINTTYRRHHRRDDQPCNEPDGGPIVLIGTLIGFLLCLTKMKRRTRLALVIIFEPVHEKTNNLCSDQVGPTQTGLYSHRRLFEDWKF